jgi:IclR family mhp operon transcriptional activator
MRAEQELKSLKRGLRALALLNQTGSVTIAQLSRELGLPRTTTERILETLASEGYVERFPSEKHYHLKSKVCGLSSGFSDESWIVDIAKPLLFETTERIGWPLAIAAPESNSMAVRLTTDPATSLWLNRRRVGAIVPIGGSCSGHAFLAFATPAEREALLAALSGPDVPETHRIADVERMRQICETIRRDGFATNPDLGSERSISVPIMIEGSVKGILLAMYMARVMDTEDAIKTFVPQLKRLSATISERVLCASGRVADGAAGPALPKPIRAQRN